MCHSHASPNKTVTGNGTIVLEMSLFAFKPLGFVRNWTPFNSCFPASAHTIFTFMCNSRFFQWVSHIKGKRQQTKQRGGVPPDTSVRFLSAVLKHLLRKSDQSRFAFHLGQIVQEELNKRLSPVTLPLLLITSYSYCSAKFIADLVLLGISRIHQEDRCHDNDVATGRVR